MESFHGEFLLNSFDGLDEFAINDFEGHLHLAAGADTDEFVAFASHSRLKEMFFIDFYQSLYLKGVSSWAGKLGLGADGDGVGINLFAVIPVSNNNDLVARVGYLGH